MTQQKLGELNGKWAILFKVMLGTSTVVLPVVLTMMFLWGAWVTDETHKNKEFREQTKTYEAKRITAVNANITNHILKFGKEIDRRIDSIENNQARILTLLERLQPNP